jgi:hypothetical protein
MGSGSGHEKKITPTVPINSASQWTADRQGKITDTTKTATCTMLPAIAQTLADGVLFHRVHQANPEMIITATDNEAVMNSQ